MAPKNMRSFIDAVDDGITVSIYPSWLKIHDHVSLSNQFINQCCQRQNEADAKQRKINSRTKRAGIKVFVDIIHHGSTLKPYRFTDAKAAAIELK
jgi:hypothetical protein